MLHAGPLCLKIKSSSQLYKFYIKELKKKGAILLFKLFTLHPARHQVLSPAVSFLQHLKTNVLGNSQSFLSYKALSFSSNP
jgi:hypothetical protein